MGRSAGLTDLYASRSWGAEVAITKLTVENFKSFDKLEVELRPFNIVVGSNASGKSNFPGRVPIPS